jgi:hypothetical protein
MTLDPTAIAKYPQVVAKLPQVNLPKVFGDINHLPY